MGKLNLIADINDTQYYTLYSYSTAMWRDQFCYRVTQIPNFSVYRFYYLCMTFLCFQILLRHIQEVKRNYSHLDY